MPASPVPPSSLPGDAPSEADLDKALVSAIDDADTWAEQSAADAPLNVVEQFRRDAAALRWLKSALPALLAARRDGDAECSCEEWQPGIKKIDAPIALAQARNPSLTYTPEFQFVPFKFCPWCGRKVRAARGAAPATDQPETT